MARGKGSAHTVVEGGGGGGSSQASWFPASSAMSFQPVCRSIPFMSQERGDRGTGSEAGGGGEGGRPVQILNPNRVRKLLGVWRGGGRRGRWIGGSAARVPKGGGGSVGTPNIHTSK